MNAVEHFRAALRATGLDYQGPIIADGRLHRFKSEGDRARNSWYVLRPGPPASGMIGCWKRRVTESWFEKRREKLTDAEWQTIRKNWKLAEAERERAEKERHAQARKTAAWILDHARPVITHTYLTLKGVKAFGGLLEYRGTLVLPLSDPDGVIHSLQFIAPDKRFDGARNKSFLGGGRKAGCSFFLADKPDGPLIICEGYATGASIHEATGYAVVCAMDCGNLLVVAQALRAKWPLRDIILAADDDRWTNKNPGLDKATQAAKNIRAKLAIPQFKEISTKPTDFNDLHNLEGIEIVKEQIENALMPADQDWPEPKPLLADLPAVPPFNYDWLPNTLRDWVEDIAERMQCPPDFVAVGVMVALSSVVGRKVGIRPKRYDDWLVVPNLWGGIVGRPGLMKTPALMDALLPLRRLAIEADKKHKAEMEKHKVTAILKTHRAKAAQWKIDKHMKAGHEQAAREEAEAIAKEGDDEPVRRRYETNDPTIEKLGEILAQNPNGLILFRDELYGFLSGLDRQGHESDRATYLEMWNGIGTFTCDRIKRGTVQTPAILCLLGGIQPDLLTTYTREAVRGGQGADGLLQRFQMVTYPDMPGEWRHVDRWPNAEAKNKAFEVFKYLDDLTAESVGADTSDGIPFLRFTDDAQERFDLWRAELERKLRSDSEHPAFEAHLAKYRKLIPALALLTHLANRETGPVSLVALEKALLWAAYLKEHARRVYSAVLRPDAAAARELAKHLQRGDLLEQFNLREVYRKNWTALSDKEDAEAATEILSDLGWIRMVPETGRSNGRPASPSFEINPKILNSHKSELTELPEPTSVSSGSESPSIIENLKPQTQAASEPEEIPMGEIENTIPIDKNALAAAAKHPQLILFEEEV